MLYDRKGFTLMELVIGMCILGLIIALTAPMLISQYQSWREQAAAEQIASNMQDLASGAQQYLVQTGSMPTAISGEGTTLTAKGIISAPPNPPAGGGAYTVDATTYATTWGGTASVAITSAVANIGTCQQINNLYAGKAATATPATAVDATLNLQCFGDAGTYTALAQWYR